MVAVAVRGALIWGRSSAEITPEVRGWIQGSGGRLRASDNKGGALSTIRLNYRRRGIKWRAWKREKKRYPRGSDTPQRQSGPRKPRCKCCVLAY